MNLLGSLSLAIWAVRAHPFRTAMTCLSMGVGVAAVIMVASIILGFGQQIEKLAFGAYGRSIVIAPSFYRFEDIQPPRLEDINELRTVLKSIDGVAAWRSERAQFNSLGARFESMLHGVSGDFLDEIEMSLKSGKTFSEPEMKMGRRLCILGSAIAERLFDKPEVVGNKIQVNGAACEVIGVFAPAEVRTSEKFDNSVFTPLAAHAFYFTNNVDLGPSELSRLTVILKHDADMEDARFIADVKLRKLRGSPMSQPSPYRYEEPGSSARALEKQRDLLANLLFGLACVAMISGITGFVSIMLANVNERKREIAIRLAIGARTRDVTSQFLIEAGIVGLMGGLVGGAGGLGLGWVVAKMWDWPYLADFQLSFMAVILGVVSGGLAGLVPAWKASQSEPAEAMRN